MELEEGVVGGRGFRFGLGAFAPVAFSLLLGGGPSAAQETSRRDAPPQVTAAEGTSWRRHLGLSSAQSAMGKMGFTTVGQTGPSSPAWGHSSTPESLERPFVLTGADLYRLNCQSCHNVGGSGSPPEISSLVNAVRATSPDLTRQQMAKRGLEIDPAMVRQMTAQAEASLRDRLVKGGEKMPPFQHLRGPEVDATLAYLKEIAGVTGPAAKPRQVTLSASRVGEHVVKGTCFVCHDATGPGSDAMVSTVGLIPSLASFVEQKSVVSVVRKVREGAPAPGLPGSRGDMPVFSYLTSEEVSAAYFYLLLYPPRSGDGK